MRVWAGGRSGCAPADELLAKAAERCDEAARDPTGVDLTNVRATLDQAAEALRGLPFAPRQRRIASLQGRIASLQRLVDQAGKVLTLVRDLEAVRGNDIEHGDPERTDRAYARAFRDYGLDLDATEPKEAGSALARYGEAGEAAAALDDWGFVRKKLSSPGGERDWRRIVAVARAADPDARRDALRARFGRWSAAELQAFAAPARSAPDRPETRILLARALRSVGKEEKATEVLRANWESHPGEFWSNFELGMSCWSEKESRFERSEEAERYLTVALAIRPGSSAARKGLGVVLLDQGRLGDTAAALRAAIGNDTRLAVSFSGLGSALRALERAGGAAYAYRAAILREPQDDRRSADPKHVKELQGEWEEAIAKCREATQLVPDLAAKYLELGTALRAQKKRVEAAYAYRAAVQRKPDNPKYHLNFGIFLAEQRDWDKAIDEYRRSIDIRPDARAHNKLAAALRERGGLDGAIDEYCKAIGLRPDDGESYLNLGLTLAELGRAGEAADAFRAAIEPMPDRAMAYTNLGHALAAQWWKEGEAIDAYREAIRHDPNQAPAYAGLGFALLARWKPWEAADQFVTAFKLSRDHANAHLDELIRAAQVVLPGMNAAWADVKMGRRLMPQHRRPRACRRRPSERCPRWRRPRITTRTR